ncbi:hypothetical protein SAMN05216227_10135 [Pseudorhodobacter antarcticus]|uniref:Uncharacterized protein n=3 Tax=Pseudorhodobacter antarcticus TaxID=1077947 RepID=A0A1H8G628_9RHOB|nr:hypothetical protein SAMN05216227_10135 [Pseudorhodobacter antarcticus]
MVYPGQYPLVFQMLDQSTMTVLGSVTVQSTGYESYSFTITPSTPVTSIVIRPMGAGLGTYPSLIIDKGFMRGRPRWARLEMI